MSKDDESIIHDSELIIMASSCIFLILLLMKNLMKPPGMGMRLKIEFRSLVKYFNVKIY